MRDGSGTRRRALLWTSRRWRLAHAMILPATLLPIALWRAFPAPWGGYVAWSGLVLYVVPFLAWVIRDIACALDDIWHIRPSEVLRDVSQPPRPQSESHSPP